METGKTRRHDFQLHVASYSPGAFWKEHAVHAYVLLADHSGRAV
jgi:hypothetical protein